jgi:hypothetical protein
MNFPGYVIWIIQIEVGGNTTGSTETFSFNATARMDNFPQDGGYESLGVNAFGTGNPVLGVKVFPARFSTGQRDGPCRLRIVANSTNLDNPRFEIRVVAMRAFR